MKYDYWGPLDLNDDWLIEYIRDNYDPDDVFKRPQLVDWAEGEDFISPQDTAALEDWAEDHGYVKKETA